MKKAVKYISFLILFGLFHYSASSQINFPLELEKADSLQEILPTIQGIEKVDVLNTMSYALIRHYSNISDSLAGLSLELAEQLDYKGGKAMALYCKGTNIFIYGDFIEALDMLYEALDLFKEMGDTAMIIDTYYVAAETYLFSGTDRFEAIRLGEEALQYSILSNNKRKTAQMYSALQYVWGGYIGNAEKSLVYIKKYKSVIKELTAHNLESIMIEAAVGRSLAIKGEYRKAIKHCLKATNMLKPDNIEERAFLSQQYSANGNIYLRLGVLDSAFYSYANGMRLARKNKHYYGSLENSMGFARYYHAIKDDRNTVVYCDSVLYFGKKIDSLGSFYGVKEYQKILGISGEIYMPTTNAFKRYYAWKMMTQAYSLLLKIYQNQNSYKKAFMVNKSYAKIKDSIVAFQNRKEILDLQYKYQTKQKDHQILLLSKENQIQVYKISRSRLILFSVIAILALLLFIFILIFYQNMIKSDRRVSEIKQKLLRSQMNPHFIFNSLTSIQSFIVQQDDIKASVYLSKFSDLVRNILTNSQKELIKLEEDIDTLENYLELQKIRFPDRFEYHLSVDDQLNQESINIPPMLNQPFVENAIEHGFKNRETKGQINLKFTHKQDALLIEIEDNGIGRQKSQEIKSPMEKDHKSQATLITQERIKIINKKLKQKIHFEIIDLMDSNGKATGTKVVFEIPLSF